MRNMFTALLGLICLGNQCIAADKHVVTEYLCVDDSFVAISDGKIQTVSGGRFTLKLTEDKAIILDGAHFREELDILESRYHFPDFRARSEAYTLAKYGDRYFLIYQMRFRSELSSGLCQSF